MTKKRRSTPANLNKIYFDLLRFGNRSVRPEAIRSAPPSVIRSISNAACHVAYNPKTRLSPAQRKLLSRLRRQIEVLTSSAASVKKRDTLQRGGVLPFLPVLLGSALPTLGAYIFSE